LVKNSQEKNTIFSSKNLKN
jgi:hypothetical protein